MKRLIILLLALICTSGLNAQTNRTSSSYGYGGLGYSLVIFTNSDANDTYPAMDFSNNDFLKEINLFAGYRANDKLAVELSPSFIFTRTASNDGFYFSENGQRRFYRPYESRIFALPINAVVKYYPFTKSTSFTSNIFLGAFAGAMYISESFDNYIYQDNNLVNLVGARTYKNDFWTSNFGVTLGFTTAQKFGYGFEVSYRMVPLKQDLAYPLTTSIASDMNSINLSIKLLFGF